MRSKLVEFREGKQLSRAAMAARLGISRPQLSRLENGQRDPRAAFIDLFASEFEIPIDAAYRIFFDSAVSELVTGEEAVNA